MIPQVVADVRDILTKTFKVDPDTALKIAWALYEAKHLKDGNPLRWPIQAEGIGLILTEVLNIPETATKIAKAIQSGNY